MSNIQKLINILKWHKDIGIDVLYKKQGRGGASAVLSRIKDRRINLIKEMRNDMPTRHINNKIEGAKEMKRELRREIKEHSYYDKISKCKDIDELKAMVMAFDECALKAAANNTVFGEGDVNAGVMLIGEAPGATEDEKGVPFCGQSGKLLDNALLSIGLTRNDVYITNTVFWRPPGNRRPTADEIFLCRPFLEKHISLVKPKLIVLVGGTASETVLQKEGLGVNNMRNNWFEYKDVFSKGESAPIKAMTIFHPSYLLRQQSKKKEMWFDMLRILNFLKA